MCVQDANVSQQRSAPPRACSTTRTSTRLCSDCCNCSLNQLLADTSASCHTLCASTSSHHLCTCPLQTSSKQVNSLVEERLSPCRQPPHTESDRNHCVTPNVSTTQGRKDCANKLAAPLNSAAVQANCLHGSWKATKLQLCAKGHHMLRALAGGCGGERLLQDWWKSSAKMFMPTTVGTMPCSRSQKFISASTI